MESENSTAIGPDASRPRRSPLRRWLPAAIGLTLVAALTVAAWPRGERVATLPELTLERVGGGALTLDALGRPVVLNLWATWCGPCRRELPRMAELDARFRGIAFVFAAQREAEADVARYLDEGGLDLELVVLDARGELAERFRSPGLPTTLFFDAEGRLTKAHLGEISSEQLFNETVALLAAP